MSGFMDDKIIRGKVSIAKTGIYIKAETEQGYDLDFRFVLLPELKTLGVSNLTIDQKFILFLDYDRITEDMLGRQLVFLWKEYGISHFLVVKTGEKRYHVINFEKYAASELQNIVNNTLCDYTYKTVALRSDKGWILRLYPKFDRDGNKIKDKPVFHKFEWFGNPKRELSRGHLELFASIYPEFREIFKSSPVLEECFMDNNTNVSLIKYGTSKRNLLTNFNLDDMVKSKKLNIRWVEDAN